MGIEHQDVECSFLIGSTGRPKNCLVMLKDGSYLIVPWGNIKERKYDNR